MLFRSVVSAGFGALVSQLSGLDSFDAEVHKYYDLRDTERPVDAFSDQIAANAIDEGVNAKAVAVQAKRQGFRLER